MDYESGVAVAFLIALARFILSVATHFSTAASNMRKIGLRRSWLDGNYHPITHPKIAFVSWCVMSVVAILFSWVGVFMSAVLVVYIASKQAGMPAAAKEVAPRAVALRQHLVREGISDSHIETPDCLALLERLSLFASDVRDVAYDNWYSGVLMIKCVSSRRIVSKSLAL